jgi:hypothetical protein
LNRDGFHDEPPLESLSAAGRHRAARSGLVTKAANPGSSAIDQARTLAEQIARAPNGAIKTRETLPMGGQDAPYFVATYTAADSAGVATPFAHTQIVLDHGAHYYLISYSGPVPIYQKHIGVFQNMVQTFQFTR